VKEKAFELKCEELESIVTPDNWNKGAFIGFGVGTGLAGIVAGAVTWFAFT
jgi:hypothetical protein